MIISTEFENTHYGVQEAAGSNPVTRTKEQVLMGLALFLLLLYLAFWSESKYG